MGTCCSYPNGLKTLLPSLSVIPAIVLSCWGVFSCDFVSYESDRFAMTAIGLFWKYLPAELADKVLLEDWDVERWENVDDWGDLFADENFYIGSCSPYSYTAQSIILYSDGSFKAAGAFGLTAVVLGLVMTIVLWIVAPCTPLPKTGWRIIGLILAIIGLFQMFTLLILSSAICSTGCGDLRSGGVVSIVSGVLWFITSGFCFLVGDPPAREVAELPVTVETPSTNLGVTSEAQTKNEKVIEQTTEEQHVKADGTIVKEKTTTRADGSVTVTTEVIPPGTAVGSVVDGKM